MDVTFTDPNGPETSQARSGRLSRARARWQEGSRLGRFFLIVLAALVVAMGVLWTLGFRAFFIQTPSMGTTAPVGSLVVTQPASDYHVGDIISFHQVGKTYTHRIVRASGGTFSTKGDLNGGQDGWVLHKRDIVGKVIFHSWGIGWVWKGLPLLIIGFLLVYLITLLPGLGRSWIWPLRLSGGAVVFSIVQLWLRPWLNMDMLGFTPADHGGGVLFHVVNTGTFPLGVDGTRIVKGQDAVVQVAHTQSDGFYHLTPHPALGLTWTIFVVVLCLLPVLASLMVRPPLTEVPRHSNTLEGEALAEHAEEIQDRRRLGARLGIWWTLFVLALASALILVILWAGHLI